MEKAQVTAEIRQAVRREECATNGHSFDALMVSGSADPVGFMCPNCGRRWRVVPA